MTNWWNCRSKWPTAKIYFLRWRVLGGFAVPGPIMMKTRPWERNKVRKWEPWISPSLATFLSGASSLAAHSSSLILVPFFHYPPLWHFLSPPLFATSDPIPPAAPSISPYYVLLSLLYIFFTVSHSFLVVNWAQACRPRLSNSAFYPTHAWDLFFLKLLDDLIQDNFVHERILKFLTGGRRWINVLANKWKNFSI